MDPDLADLARAYRDSLVERRFELSGLRSGLRLGAGEAAIARLHALAHQVAGSAGAYGYPALGEAARLLDEQLRQSAEAGAVCGPEVLQSLIEALHSGLDATIAALEGALDPLS